LRVAVVQVALKEVGLVLPLGTVAEVALQMA
jgi:hypothetical protein